MAAVMAAPRKKHALERHRMERELTTIAAWSQWERRRELAEELVRAFVKNEPSAMARGRAYLGVVDKLDKNAGAIPGGVAIELVVEGSHRGA
jgi:hypothetical protein